MQWQGRGINLHIVRTAVSHDSRVQKETGTLVKSGRFSAVRICGFHESGYKDYEVLNGCELWRVSLKTRSLPKDLLSQSVKYAEWFSRVVSEYGDQDIRVIHCHALGPLPIAVRLKRLVGAKLVYDAHELQSETYGAKGIRKRLARWSERLMGPNIDAIIAVSQSICDWYAENFPEIPVNLLRNIPARLDRAPEERPLRFQLQVPEDALLFMFVGSLNPGKGIEQAIEAFKHEDVRHHLLFLGKGPLQDHVQSSAKRCSRIHYAPPVRPDEILHWVAGADVTICLTLDSCLSRRYSLPNKLFESMVAGVPVVASNLPELSRVISEHDAGWLVSPDVHAFRRLVACLTVEDVRRKKAGLADRTEHLNWQNESLALLRVYDSLLTGKPRDRSKI